MGEPRFWIAVASFWVRWSWSHDLFCRSDLTAYFWSIAICSPLYWCLDIGNLARNPCEIKYLSNIHQALISGTGNVYFFQLMNFQNLFSVVNYTALIFLRPLFSGTRVTFYTPPSPPLSHFLCQKWPTCSRRYFNPCWKLQSMFI